MEKGNEKINKDEINTLLDLSIKEKIDNLPQRYFNLEINEKKYIPIDKSIKTKKNDIYDLLKTRILNQKDFVISKNTNSNPLLNNDKIKKMQKQIRFSNLHEKIEFGPLNYFNIQNSEGLNKKNQETISSNIKSLLKSQNFKFSPWIILGKKKYSHSPKNKNNIIKNEKDSNKTVLGIFGLKKMENKIKTYFNNKENEEINKNYYFNTESSEIFKDNNDNNYYIFNSDNNNINKFSKDLSFFSETSTPLMKMYISIKSKNKKNLTISRNLYSKITNKGDKIKNIKEEKKKCNTSRRYSLEKLILNCLNNNDNSKRNNSIPRRKKKRSKTKYNYNYTKTFISKNNEKILKNFHKYVSLMEKEINDNLKKTEDNNTQNNIFIKNKKLEKEIIMKKNFYKIGSKTISSLMNSINLDQMELNNRLFKIIDRANKPVKKEKKIDEVLEIILDKKRIKQKKMRAKEIFINTFDAKKILEERNKIRFMNRFADLIKDMNDDMALNYTKHILERNSKLYSDFTLPKFTKYKKLKELKYKEQQKNIRNKMKQKIGEIEKKIIINDIEKDNLYSKYENVFKKNKFLKKKDNYKSLNNAKKEDKTYHNIVQILNCFEKENEI